MYYLAVAIIANFQFITSWLHGWISKWFNKACGKHNLTILLSFVLLCKLHTFTAQTFLTSYLLKTYVFKNEHNCFKFLVLGKDVCNLRCRIKS